jgi:hypothetical protein
MISPRDWRFTHNWVNPIAWTTRMKRYQMPHAKAMAKIHVDISWPYAASTALAVAKGASRGQIVIRRWIRVLCGKVLLILRQKVRRASATESQRSRESVGKSRSKILCGFERKEKASHPNHIECFSTQPPPNLLEETSEAVSLPLLSFDVDEDNLALSCML